MSQTEAKNAIISYILKNMKSFKLQCVCDLCVCVCVCVCARTRICIPAFTLQLFIEVSEIELSYKSSHIEIYKWGQTFFISFYYFPA